MEAVSAEIRGPGEVDVGQFERYLGRPILILTVGRSGSSMVANIFRDHGLWLGVTKPGDRFNAKGYFENQPLKRAMKKAHGFDVSGPMPETRPEWRGTVRRVLVSQGYRGGPWGFKTGVHYWNIWGDFDPVFVKVIRNRDAIVESYARYGGAFLHHGEAFIDRGLGRLRGIPGYTIDTDELVSGDFRQMRYVLSNCGLDYDDAKVKSVVDKDLWHAN